MTPRRARHAVPLAVALAAWGLAAWACYNDTTLDGDDFITGVLAVVASAWALLDYYYRRGARERQALQADTLENLTVAAAEGVVAFAKQQGDGQRARGTRRSS